MNRILHGYCYRITFTCARYLQICQDHSPCWPSVRCVNTLYRSWSTCRSRSVNMLTARAPLPESSCPAAARRAPGAGRRNHCARALSQLHCTYMLPRYAWCRYLLHSLIVFRVYIYLSKQIYNLNALKIQFNTFSVVSIFNFSLENIHIEKSLKEQYVKRFSRFYFECSIVDCKSGHTSDSCSQKQHFATNGSDPRDWLMVSIVHSTHCFHSAQTSFTKLMAVCLFPLKLVICTSCTLLTSDSDPQIHEISTFSTFPISKLEVCRQCWLQCWWERLCPGRQQAGIVGG